MKNAYFTEKDEKIYFTGVYMEAYIPDELFNKDISMYDGDIIETIGLFNYRVFNNIDEDRNKIPLKTLKVPTVVKTKPNSVSMTTLELIPGSGEKKYHVLKYFTDDILLTQSYTNALVDNVEKYIKLLNEGKIPNTIPYDEILDLTLKNLELNKINLNVSATLLSTVISEIYRYKKDMALPFRKIIGKDVSESQFNYVNTNARTICSFNSTTSALTFEDIDSMITTSINKKRYNRKENYTPIEKLLE